MVSGSWRLAIAFSFIVSLSLAQVQVPIGQFQPAPYINATWTNSTGVSVSISTKNGTKNDTAPYLSGLIFEDISHSGDGGIYAELVRNRAFQGSGVTIGAAEPLLPGMQITASENPTLPFAPVLDGWYPVGDARISLDLLHPLSDALQVALQVDIPINATGEVGIKNDGWWGMNVAPQTYNSSFYVQANGYRYNWTITHFDVSLRDNTTGEVFVSDSIPVGSTTRPVPYEYRNYSTQLVNTVKASTSNNSLYITMDADELRGQTLYFDLISLFPETYHDRPNGLRKDLAEHLEAGNFKFLRFPGGNNLEGYSIARRWKWWKTIGPLINRPGRPGDWSYYNTDGLGLLEYMYWCEDMNLAPLVGVYAGFSLDIAAYDSSNSTDANELPISMMQPILQEALDELEYLMGDTSTYWGAQRAAHGHPEPFDVPFVEIGNEDFFSHDYPARAAFMLKGLKAVYPQITYVYTAADEYPEYMGTFNISLPRSVVWDDHVYDQPSWFIENFNEWDNWQASSYISNISSSEDVFAGLMEYHVSSIDNRTGDPTWNITTAGITHPRMLSAVAEAVYALGWERNPNTFKLSAFAPAIQNVNFYRSTPYLMLFGANPVDDLLSVSYYQEQIFNLHEGTQSLPFTITEGHFNPLFFAAQIDEPQNAIYFKIVNAGNTTQTLALRLDVAYSNVNGTILEPPTPGDLNAFNYFNNKTAIVPKAISGLEGFGINHGGWTGDHVFNWTVPAYSINVLQFDLSSHAENGTYGGNGSYRGWPRQAAPKALGRDKKLPYDLEDPQWAT